MSYIIATKIKVLDINNKDIWVHDKSYNQDDKEFDYSNNTTSFKNLKEALSVYKKMKRPRNTMTRIVILNSNLREIRGKGI